VTATLSSAGERKDVPGFDLATCLARLAERNPGRTEADIQADVREVLLFGGFDLGEEHVRLESPAPDRRRIDVEVGALVIECKRDLRSRRVLGDAEHQLAGYLADREGANGGTYVGVLTDGVAWRCYRTVPNGVEEVSVLELRPGFDERRFRYWLGSLLATERLIAPTAESIEERLGSESPGCRLALAELTELWRSASDLPVGQLKRSLWGKLLRTALGTQFEDEDMLFVEHTYLVLVTSLIADAVIGFDVGAPSFSPAVALSGQLFSQAGIEGVGEAGFFDWVLDTDGGELVVTDVARRVACFRWEGVDHDVLKALYESVIAPETRHRLGEYYTPDWLAERMVEEVVADPLHSRVLDPACGSGTFLFHAVRRHLRAAQAAGVPTGEALASVTGQVFGLDLHPVAVILAQVTYLLAIGTERLAARTGRLSVPVYLGDSMRWEAAEENFLTPSGEVVVPTGDGHQLFAAELRFPAETVADVARFDQLVDALAERASNRSPGTPHRPLGGLLARFGVGKTERSVLEETYALLCDLHDQGRNHIWAFYVRNQARPTWFAQPEHRVDVLVGNPPWLSYRYMPAEMQARFAERARARHLWAGGRVATHQDLSAFFVARAIELYLAVGGRFAFVMPRATLTRQAYDGFRKADFSSPGATCAAAFETPWDLGAVEPEPFPVPSAVVLGERVDSPETPPRVPLPSSRIIFSGRTGAHGGWAVAARDLAITTGEGDRAFSLDDVPHSPYAERFRQGATLVPRMLLFVVDQPRGPVGTPKGLCAVRSRRGALDKVPWRNLPDHVGIVEEVFVRPTYLGEHVLPFRLLPPAKAIIPYDGTRLLSGADDRIDRYSGLAEWWRSAEMIWDEHKATVTRLSLLERIDYHGELSAQFPPAPIRVMYSKSGNTLAAAVLTNPRAVIDHKLYWAAASSLDEARYLAALLNAPILTELVRPYQSVGAFGPRDFDKYVWYVPVPEYNAENDEHRRLVELADRAERVAASVELPERMGFQAARRLIREALRADGVATEIDGAVSALVGTAAPAAG
jgi:SAM-dependent methyltransferase